MCGIFGAINLSLNNKEIKEILSTISHRGPDNCGIYENKNDSTSIIFGHQRLEILDIKNGSQPMVSEDNNVVVVFNGEIYNFNELRKQLSSLGHKFNSSHSDTEILIHGFKEWGQNLPEHLQGMWSFAIYDKIKNKIFLSRDRFGEKPLYYLLHKNTFIFSSELKALNVIRDIKLTIKNTNIKKYCAYGFLPFNLTPYNNVYQLEAGHNIYYKILENKIIKNKYWDYNIEPNYKISENEWCEKIFYFLNESVKKMLVADVPIGVFLSGGIDSSIISYLAQENSRDSIKTFSIGFEESSFDESKYSDFISKKIQSKHFHHKIMSNDISSISKEYLSKIYEPISDSSLISYYQLCKFTSNKVKVCLGGDGADELFAGYDTFKAMRYLSIAKTLKLTKLNPLVNNLISIIPTKYNYMNTKFKLDRFLKFSGNNLATAHGQWLSPLSANDITELFNEPTNDEEIYSEAINLWEKNKYLNNIDNSLEFYGKIFLQNQILVKTDRLSMLNGLEVRSPFLDLNFVDCARQIPSKLKLKGSITKYILKKTFEKTFGKKFTYRKKMGFSAPISKWIINNSDDFKINSNFLKRKNNFIQSKLFDHLSYKSENRLFLWNILNLDSFFHKNNY